MAAKNILARVAITLAAAALFFLIRPDMLLYARGEHQRLLGTKPLRVGETGGENKFLPV